MKKGVTRAYLSLLQHASWSFFLRRTGFSQVSSRKINNFVVCIVLVRALKNGEVNDGPRMGLKGGGGGERGGRGGERGGGGGGGGRGGEGGGGR